MVILVSRNYISIRESHWKANKYFKSCTKSCVFYGIAFKHLTPRIRILRTHEYVDSINTIVYPSRFTLIIIQ
jgi:hypothetical protein